MIRLIIEPITTIQPAITVIIVGINGTVKVLLIIPKPTARDTKMPVIHKIMPIRVLLESFLLDICVA